MDVTECKFALSEYKDSTGRILPMYVMNQAAVDLITTGYDIKRRAEIIEEFHAMRRYLEETRYVVRGKYSPRRKI